jgi:hypothetical protein
MVILPLLVICTSARFFIPEVLPYERSSPQVQFSQIQPPVALRSSTPTMIATPDLSTAERYIVLPATLIADGGTTSSVVLLAVGVLAFVFLFAVVGTVVVNFGIRKK